MAWVRCCGGQAVPLVNFPWDGLTLGGFNKVNTAVLSPHSSDYFYTQVKAPKIGANLNLKWQMRGSGWYSFTVSLQYSTDGNTWTQFFTGTVSSGENTVPLNDLYGKAVYFKVLITDTGGYNAAFTLYKFTIE
jgi:hypothetical protein